MQAQCNSFSIADDTSTNNAFSGLALVLGALQQLEDTSPQGRDDLVRRLGAINVEASPWRYSAREILALIAVETEGREQGAKLFGQLADDMSAPQGIRSRARNLAAQLGS